MSIRNIEEHRPTRNGNVLTMGPFPAPPSVAHQQALTLFAATAILTGYVVAHVRDDNAKTVAVLASPRPVVTA